MLVSDNSARHRNEILHLLNADAVCGLLLTASCCCGTENEVFEGLVLRWFVKTSSATANGYVRSNYVQTSVPMLLKWRMGDSTQDDTELQDL